MTDLGLSHPSPGRATQAERLFVVVVLLFAAGAFASLWTMPGQTAKASGMPVMQALWTLVYLVTLYLFFRRCDQPLRTLFSEWPLLALCAFATISVLWSEVPGLSIRRSIALTLTVLFGMYFASRFHLKEQLRLLAWTCAIFVVFSFLFGIFGLGRSVDYGEGVLGWYGIFDQKNDLGRMMVVSALVFLFWKRTEPEHKWLANAGLFASIVLVALSRSMTSVVLLLPLLLLLPYLGWTSRKSLRWMVAGILFLAGVTTASLLYAATHWEQVTGFLGKSPLLTGRIQLWILSVVVALRRPWLGYGYNAFWLQSEPLVRRIWLLLAWDAPHAHNGFLEIWIELGLVGLGLFLLVYFFYVARSVRFLRQHRGTGAAAWPLVFLLFNLLINSTEVDFLSRNNIIFILFVSCAFATRLGPGHAWASDAEPLPDRGPAYVPEG